MKLIFLCFCSIVALKTVICTPDASLCNKNNFSEIPSNNCGAGNEGNWIMFLIQAQKAENNLCRRISNPNTHPAVQNSSINILTNIIDLYKAGFRINGEIIENCKQLDQNCEAAKAVNIDLGTRIECFTTGLKSTNGGNIALMNLGTCVQASAMKASTYLAKYSPKCQEIANNVETSNLQPIQEYYSDTNRFQKDFSIVVESNNL